MLQALGVFAIWQQRGQLVSEYRAAAGLEYHQRRAGIDLWLQRQQDALQLRLGLVEHAIVVERTPAAQRLFWQPYFEAAVLEHLDRRPRRIGIEVVVERVGPEQHLRSALRLRPSAREPASKSFGRKGRYVALLGHAREPLGDTRRARALRDQVDEPGRQTGKA